jgi:DNA-binding response OmpR family regulator
MKILYVEDEPSLARIVRESLESRNFTILHLENGNDLVNQFNVFSPDLCLFDVMLPIKDGYTLAQEVRDVSPDIPIIFITALDQTSDVIKGFESGGNDYIKKPFSLEELIVRINNLYNIKRVAIADSTSSQESICLGSYEYHATKLELSSATETKRLTFREAQLLTMLVRGRNSSVMRKDILLEIWGDDSFFNSRSLDVYITKLRSYFKNDPLVEIITLKAVGYRMLY